MNVVMLIIVMIASSFIESMILMIVCDMFSTAQYASDPFWRCDMPAVYECCDRHYCDICFDMHKKFVRHDCYCCENTGVVVNKVGLINIGQACVLCEGDV